MQLVFIQIRRFAHEHDDMPAFHAGYLVLALLAAGLFNLGVFGLIVFAHMVLDFVKYRDHHGYGWKMTLEGVIRESLVDITLIGIGLVFSVYLHHTVGVASVSGLMRAELTVVRAVALLVPKVKILHHFLKIMAHLHLYLDHIHPRMRTGWSALDHLCFYFLGISAFLILFAAPLMHVSWDVIGDILKHELIPWHL